MDRRRMTKRQYERARRTRLEILMGRLQTLLFVLMLVITYILYRVVLSGDYEKAASPVWGFSLITVLFAILVLQIVKTVPKTRRGIWKLMHRTPDKYRWQKHMQKNATQPAPVQTVINKDGTEIPF